MSAEHVDLDSSPVPIPTRASDGTVIYPRAFYPDGPPQTDPVIDADEIRRIPDIVVEYTQRRGISHEAFNAILYHSSRV